MAGKKAMAGQDDKVAKRLDALIRIILETHWDKKNEFNRTDAAKVLNSCGLGPQEIADIMGRSRTDIGSLLYRNPKRGKASQPRPSKSEDEGHV